jgi:uncharacterized ion transporter superfamily protein YfcC
MFVAGIALWIGWTMRHAVKHRVSPVASALGGAPVEGLTRRDGAILVLILVPFAMYVVGVIQLGWGFNELSALFFLAAVVIGIVGGLGPSGSVTAFLNGMQTMVAASMLVGVARGISVVLTDGRVIDTIVQSLASPLMDKPPAFAAVLMIPIQGLIHVVVPSVSGQAALTMPVLVPASDLIGLSRQATVMAYQTGAGLAELLTPTNGALMAVLLAAGVPFQRWVAFVLGGWGLTTLVGVAGTIAAAWMY